MLLVGGRKYNVPLFIGSQFIDEFLSCEEGKTIIEHKLKTISQQKNYIVKKIKKTPFVAVIFNQNIKGRTA